MNTSLLGNFTPFIHPGIMMTLMQITERPSHTPSTWLMVHWLVVQQRIFTFVIIKVLAFWSLKKRLSISTTKVSEVWKHLYKARVTTEKWHRLKSFRHRHSDLSCVHFEFSFSQVTIHGVWQYPTCQQPTGLSAVCTATHCGLCQVLKL